MPPGQTERAYLTRILECWNRAWPSIASQDKDPIAQTALIESEASRVNDAKGASYVFGKIVFPVFNQAGLAVARIWTNNQVTSASVRVALFRARNQRYPKNLAEAGVTSTKDPFGDALRYRVDKAGYRVWSVGPNKSDDGGLGPGYSTGIASVDKLDDIVAGIPAPAGIGAKANKTIQAAPMPTSGVAVPRGG